MYIPSVTSQQPAMQDRPTCDRSCQLWRKACTLLCLNKKTKRLSEALGNWILPYQELRRHLPLYSRLDDRVYVWSDISEHYFSYGRINLPYRFTREGLKDEPTPFDACPTDLKLETANSFRAAMIQPDIFEN